MWTSWDYIGEIGLGAWYYSDDENFANKEFPWHLNGGGAIDGYTWTGLANSVTFGAAANHIKMLSVKVTLAIYDPSGIQDINLSTEKKIFDLQGRRVQNPSKGLYIINGRKVILK